ncbi:HAD-like domain-containing protein [Diplogelasinospora grovesii]|uniref:HAD-like domain-containing protein n=1 Tax=Diplogelasinospora grovesii TaxID=303347 RepID=A0AAN6S1F9_9PEZI|nr:HAD-like domain-containing protein [Diplogelasinospora grovesii]
MAAQSFPPVRACIFDLDGLLLNTEDLYTLCANIVLTRHGRPPLTDAEWGLKAQLMGVPGSSTGNVFHSWAKLPISRQRYARELKSEQQIHYPQCQPLPGALNLLQTLNVARSGSAQGEKVQVALASSSVRANFELKISGRQENRELLDLIPTHLRVLGDDYLGDVLHETTGEEAGGEGKKRGKPAPDIYLAALARINNTTTTLLEGSRKKIVPEECLVFEDSIVGVEAARRAGMRCVWVPHPGLAGVWKGREREVLAGRTGVVTLDDDWLQRQQASSNEDSWAEQLSSLEEFDYARYGMVVP